MPGQIKDTEIEKAIKSSRYFVALLSTRSAGERGDAQKQINKALDVRNEFSLSQVFFIPARLNEIELPFELSGIQLVDMFPDWEDGLKKILKSMKVEQNLIESVIEHQSTISPFTSLDVSHEVIKTQLFKGEKQFFVGRQNYINQIIKDKLRNPGSKVSIVGPGGSGKSQLAFKAMHEYTKEGIFESSNSNIL